ncbi:MAG TPA: GNAT family N-acetyltransferase [Candidatus Dormibacteraeota bacterium]|nr:GNAT family N-acetyltransferase [Candidatus Dormibacteraeota bacterium]
MGWDEVSLLGRDDGETAAAAAALLSRELGEGLYRAEWLLEDAASPRAAVWVTGSSPSELAGAAVARLLAPPDRSYYWAFGPAALALFGDAVGSFEAFAVEPARRRHGLGGRLAGAAFAWMRERGCDWAVTVSWQSRREGSSAGLFRRLGMTEGPTVERFYLEESQRDGWACPVCGRPCTCSATLFTLDLRR